jgi:regulator of sigma E protease
MQRFPNRVVKLSLMEKGELREVELKPVPEADWVLPRSGLNLMLARQVEKADGVASAFGMALSRTQSTIRTIYLTLRNLVTMRLSYKELHGPLGIAKTAYMVADQGWADLLLFLGFLSVNLAVLNFLPIPVLDGGHMVFLLWELVTRRKPSESVVIGATYTGMAFLLGLMTLVLYLDVFEHGFFGK